MSDETDQYLTIYYVGYGPPSVFDMPFDSHESAESYRDDNDRDMAIYAVVAIADLTTAEVV